MKKKKFNNEFFQKKNIFNIKTINAFLIIITPQH